MSSAARAIQEQVRVLALQIGVRPAARQLGLNEDTVCSWSKRYNWDTPTIQPGPENSASKLQATHVGDTIARELAENERETKLGLSKHAKHAISAINKSKHPAKWTKEAHDIAKVAGIVHGWNSQDKGGNQFTLNVLNVGSFGVTVGDTDAQP